MMIAIDFDGTICQWNNEPVEDARAALIELSRPGNSLVIHSCNSTKFIEKWMAKHDIPYNYIWDHHSAANSGAGKPVADVYIDDKGYHFTDWEAAVKHVNNLTAEKG